MVRVVQKFGGTSLADIEHIRNAARRAVAEVKAGNEVAVVVSAMGGMTDQLIDWVHGVSGRDDSAEYDSVVSAGEQISSGLLALAIEKLGVSSRSWTGWQVPVATDATHAKARIRQLDVTKILQDLKSGTIPVLAGFQGVGPDGRVTTFGRGGSDTSAVALAAALDAERCDIFTDVEGVFTSDPRIVPKARKLERITYEEMLELASQGAKVLQTRAVALAMKHRVRLQVLSSFFSTPGTLVVGEKEIVEQEIVSGIAYSRDEAKITLVKVPDQPGVAATIFGPLAEANINVDMIVQNFSEDGSATDLTFTVTRSDFDRALELIQGRKESINYQTLIPDLHVAKISVIGVGMRSHVGVAQQMFQTFAEKGINIQVISTSEIKVSVLIAEGHTELALRALHSAYGLDAS